MEHLPAYVIALTLDEYKKASSKLTSAGVGDVRHFKAINGKEEKEKYRGDRKILSFRAESEITKLKERECHSSMPSWGAVGCYLSHVELWKIASKTQDGLLVFESDVVPRNYKRVKEVFSQLKAQGRVDFMFLGYIGFGVLKDEKLAAKRVVGRVYGLQAYYISPSFAAKLLRLCFPIEVQVDSFLGYVFLDEDVRAYALREFGQKNVKGTTIQLKKVAASPFQAPQTTNLNPVLLVLVLVMVLLFLFLFAALFAAKRKDKQTGLGFSGQAQNIRKVD